MLNNLWRVSSIDSAPAEILVHILDYLPVADQLRFARTSHRMRDMVYDDTRWVARLQSMGVWNEAEARRRFEEAVKRRREAAKAPQKPAQPGQRQSTITLFDASAEEKKNQQVNAARDGFETMTV